MKRSLFSILVLLLVTNFSACDQYNLWGNGSSPYLTETTSISNDGVRVSFSEDMNHISVENVDNYTITLVNDENVFLDIIGASQISGAVVELEVDSQIDEEYLLTVNNVQSIRGKTIVPPNSMEFIGDALPEVENVASTSNTVVRVTFSEDVVGGDPIADPNSAENPDNYLITLSDNLDVSLAISEAQLVFDNVVDLTTSSQEETEYLLTVSNVQDATGNSINSWDPIDPSKRGGIFTGKRLITLPSINITNPIDDDILNGMVTIIADASDPDGIDRVEFYIDGTMVGEDKETPYEYGWNTIGYSNDYYSIMAIAYDNSGDYQTDDDTEVIVSNFGTKLLGTISNDSGNGIAVDSEGSIYVTGYTDGDLNGSFGSRDIILVKYNIFGSIEWIEQLGTSNDDEGKAVAVDANDNIYVTGYTCEDLDGVGSESYYGGTDIFLVKYDSNGNTIWIRQFGTSANEEGLGVTVRPQIEDIEVYVTGYTLGDLDGGSYGNKDIFLAKFIEDGSFGWIRQFGTSANEEGIAVAVNGSDNICITGYTEGDLDSGGPLQNIGGRDICIVNYDKAGIQQGKQMFGTMYNDEGSGIVVDVNDNVYVTGYTEGDLNGEPHSGGSNSDIFLIKCDILFNEEWTRLSGNGNDDSGCGVAVELDGNIYLTGYVSDSLHGESFQGIKDIFLMKYISTGDREWTRLLGTANAEEGLGVAADAYSNIYVTGYTEGDLGGQTNEGGMDIFTIRYNSLGDRN
ncbi:MAG: SBBP repeat-containing protein [Spirochaetota bacterium]|nr:SBBP repeat-containing protein [Spirochaetota bacterium]